MNICEEFLKSQLEMWLDNYQNDLDDSSLDEVCEEEYKTQKEVLESIDDRDIADMVSRLMNDDELWENIDSAVRYFLDEMIESKGGSNA